MTLMPSMKIELSAPDDLKRCHKIVLLDDYSDIPGSILQADEDTGEVVMSVRVWNHEKCEWEHKEDKRSFGANRIRIIRK